MRDQQHEHPKFHDATRTNVIFWSYADIRLPTSVVLTFFEQSLVRDEIMNHSSLLEVPTGKLLDKFGAGNHKPGSGSAAALMGILSGKLIVTVGYLSRKKPKYRDRHPEIEYLIKQVQDSIEPRLKELFDHDSVVFDQVIKLRIERDKAKSETEKKRLSRQALNALKEATDIPIEICELCLRLLDHASAMFDLGFEPARGDSGAAISAAVAGAMSSIFVVNLNLRSFRESKWAEERRHKVDKLHTQLETAQLDAFSRVGILKEEDIEAIQVELDA